MKRTMILYIKQGCPFCARVLDVARELGITFTLKDIAGPAVASELVALGGKRQVPYLMDEAHGAEMYESEDIVAYLKKHYGMAHGAHD